MFNLDRFVAAKVTKRPNSMFVEEKVSSQMKTLPRHKWLKR